MTDDPTGLALREHLDAVLADVAPRSSLLDGIHDEYGRRMRRRATVVAGGSALTAAAATATVLVASNIGAADRGVAPDTEPSASSSPTDSPTYPPPQPPERIFTGPYAFPRPSGEVATFPLALDQNDPADSRRTLLVWYNAPEDSFCASEILQTSSDPGGGGGGGGCSATPTQKIRRTGLVLGSENCANGGWGYWFGVVGADTATVEAHAAGGSDPTVTVRQLDGAPTPFFVVTDIDIHAPEIDLRYLDADGNEVGHQQQTLPHPASPGSCTTMTGPILNPNPNPTPSG